MRKMFVVLVAVACVFALGLPAMAGEKGPEKKFEVYGSVRMETNIQDFDKETAAATANQFDDKDLNWNIDDSSRLGFRSKIGDIGGHIQLRPQAGYDMVRLMYGTWDFGGGTLIIGHMNTPSYRGICDDCLTGGGFTNRYGDWSGGSRTPGIGVDFPIKAINGMFRFAALTPAVDGATVGIPGYQEDDTVMPLLDFALIMSSGPFEGAIKGGYQTFDAVDNTDKAYGIDTWAIGADATLTFGPFAFKANVSYGENMGDIYGSGTRKAGGRGGQWDFYPSYIAATQSVEDVTHWGIAVAADFNFTDKTYIEVAYAQRKDEIDNFTAMGMTDEGDASLIYVALFLHPVKGLEIVPEVRFTDEGELKLGNVTTDRGKRAWYGIYWRIDF